MFKKPIVEIEEDNDVDSDIEIWSLISESKIVDLFFFNSSFLFKVFSIFYLYFSIYFLFSSLFLILNLEKTR